MYVLVRWAYHEVCLYFSVTLTITFHIFIQSVNTCLAIVLFMGVIETLWYEHIEFWGSFGRVMCQK